MDNPRSGRPQPFANSNSGNGNLRPETLGATRREKSAQRAKPTVETGSPHAGYGNVALFLTLGNHVGLRGLPGGAEGIRTDGHRGRSEISSYSSLRRSRRSFYHRRKELLIGAGVLSPGRHGSSGESQPERILGWGYDGRPASARRSPSGRMSARDVAARGSLVACIAATR